MYAPKFEIRPDLLRILTEAAEIRAWIANAVIDVPWLPRIQRETAARLAHSSTSIEGNPLTLPEVEALARGEEIGAPAEAQQEVVNYLAATRWIWKRKANERVGEPALLRLHRLLMQKLLPKDQVGRYKKRPNRVVDAQGRAVYVPPDPSQARSLTLELLAWIESRPSQAIHPIIVSAIAHHRLVSIHPFADGNGRISRSLEIWLLHVRGFDTHHLFALDEFFEQDRGHYYQKIQQARDLDDDLSFWLEYVAEGVAQTLKRTQERIRSLQVSTRGPSILLTRRQEELLRFFRDKGWVRSPEIEKELRLTRARVNQIIRPLLDAGLITREGQTRATRYRIR